MNKLLDYTELKLKRQIIDLTNLYKDIKDTANHEVLVDVLKARQEAINSLAQFAFATNH